MDGSRFDALTRSLVASGTRRTVVGGMLSGLLGMVGLHRAAAATCRGDGITCREHANCCSGVCDVKDRTGRRRCSECGPNAENCAGAIIQSCGDGSCACVENLDGGRTCVQRDCTYSGLSCTTGSDCPTGRCINAPGCCGGLTPFCGVPCVSATGAAANALPGGDVHRWR